MKAIYTISVRTGGIYKNGEEDSR